MNNYSLEPKDGDFVALVKQLEKKNVATIKNDIVKSNANHQAHIQKEAIRDIKPKEDKNSPVIEKLKEIEPLAMSPLEALNFLINIKKEIK